MNGSGGKDHAAAGKVTVTTATDPTQLAQVEKIPRVTLALRMALRGRVLERTGAPQGARREAGPRRGGLRVSAVAPHASRCGPARAAMVDTQRRLKLQLGCALAPSRSRQFHSSRTL